MPVIHNITQLSELSRIIKSKSGYSMTIGVFDGIHLGHQFLINETIKVAKNQNYNSCIISFSNSPCMVHHYPCSIGFFLPMICNNKILTTTENNYFFTFIKLK